MIEITSQIGNDDDFEEIQVTLKLKKNIAEVGRLIAKYRYKESFDDFASEEVRQAILATGPDGYPKQIREYANKFLEGEEM